MDEGGDLELDALPLWKSVQLTENWRDECPSPVEWQCSGSTDKIFCRFVRDDKNFCSDLESAHLNFKSVPTGQLATAFPQIKRAL